MEHAAGIRLLAIEFPAEGQPGSHPEGTRIRARLLEELAPRTCAALWQLAALSPELLGVHAAFTGRELSVRIPPDIAARVGSLDALPPENQTLFPIPGDLVWAQLPPYAWSGVAEPLYDLGIFYGRDSRLLLPVGWVAGNRFAEVLPADLPALAALAARTQIEGARRLILSQSGRSSGL
ncbi:MAG: DUF3830 family protein [Chloroflexi bacterium]|nr:DUF3830 family protein [Chloroflexota bacterium]